MKTVTATVQVQITIPDGATPVTGADGTCYGYNLPDGRRIDPAFCLRVESEDGEVERFAVTDNEISDLGFCLENYNEITIDDGGVAV